MKPDASYLETLLAIAASAKVAEFYHLITGSDRSKLANFNAAYVGAAYAVDKNALGKLVFSDLISNLIDFL